MQVVRMRKLLIVFLSYILSVNGFASQGFPRGNDIYPACYHLEDQIKEANTQVAAQPKGKIFDKSLKLYGITTFCTTATSTAFDVITTVGYTWAMNGKTAACIHEYYGFGDFSALQVLDMTVNYLRDHPEFRNQRIGTIVAAMLHNKFPVPDVCKKLK